MTDDKQPSGGFFTGLLFGAAAGVASYFFLKTEDGKKARQKLGLEWEKAKEEMAKTGVIEDATKSLPDTIQQTIQRIVEPSKKPVKQTKEAAPKKAIKTISKPEKKVEAPAKKKTETKKFKGT